MGKRFGDDDRPAACTGANTTSIADTHAYPTCTNSTITSSHALAGIEMLLEQVGRRVRLWQLQGSWCMLW